MRINNTFALRSGTFRAREAAVIKGNTSGNWHELTRALIVLIGVIAYELAIHLPIKNIFFRTVIVYVVTLACAFFTVWSTQFIEPLAKSAYKDIFMNYTGLFIVIAIIIVIFQKIRHKKMNTMEV